MYSLVISAFQTHRMVYLHRVLSEHVNVLLSEPLTFIREEEEHQWNELFVHVEICSKMLRVKVCSLGTLEGGSGNREGSSLCSLVPCLCQSPHAAGSPRVPG